MGGFETYLAAAFEKKKVPLTVVTVKASAVYVIAGVSEDKKAGWAKIAFLGDIHSDADASVQMVDQKSGAVVFAYAVNKKNTLHGDQTTAATAFGRAVWWQRHRVFGTAPSVVGTGSAVPS